MAFRRFVAHLRRRIRVRQTRDHALWQISAVGMILLFIVLVPFFPYVLAPQPESDYARIQRELYQEGDRMLAKLRGEALPADYSWFASARDAILHHIAESGALLLGIAIVASIVFAARNTRDVVREWLHRMRVRIWDTYGHEAHQQGFLTRVFAGARAPAGARTPPQPTPATAPATAAGASAPLTRRAFAIAEIVIELLIPAFARLFRGR